MPKLVLVRHGQSQWNLENRFTGWVDVELSPEGEKEAHQAGEMLKGYKFDCLFTSSLKRAQNTAKIILDVIGQPDLTTIKSEALNERHYGDLQGLNKEDIGKQYGAEQLHIWRRSYDTPPPNGESLKDTQARVIPFYEKEIKPMLLAGKDILIAAHGNSLRSLIMLLEKVSKDEITELNIPTGIPYEYDMDSELNIKSKRYLNEN